MNKDDWLSICADKAHRFDRERLMCAAVAPQDKRGALAALLAFNIEIATIPDLVTEPLLGEIRLQWWRDTVSALFEGKTLDHPVALGVSDTLKNHNLSHKLFEEFLQARGFDLKKERPDSLSELQTYIDSTAGALHELMAEVLGNGDVSPEVRKAARLSGAAWGLAGILYANEFFRRKGLSFLPRGENEEKQVRDICDLARASIDQARKTASLLPDYMQPVMLPVYLSERRLKRLRRHGFDLAHPGLQKNDPGRLIGFYWKLLTKRY